MQHTDARMAGSRAKKARTPVTKRHMPASLGISTGSSFIKNAFPTKKAKANTVYTKIKIHVRVEVFISAFRSASRAGP